MLRLVIVASVLFVAASVRLPANEHVLEHRQTDGGLLPPCGTSDVLNRGALEDRFRDFLVRRIESETFGLSMAGAAANESLAVTTTFPLGDRASEMGAPSSLSMDLRAQRLLDEIDRFRQAVEQTPARQDRPRSLLFYVPIER